LANAIHHAFDVRRIRDVALHCHDVSTTALKIVARLLQLLLVARADRHARSLSGKLAREHEPESSRSARDEHCLVSQVVLLQLPPQKSSQANRAECDCRGLQRVALIGRHLGLLLCP